MRILPKSIGLLAVAGAALVAVAAPASAAPAVAAATPVVFDLNGTYSDGGSARPVITNNNDILTVNMSSVHRPNASGVVLNSDTILVTFPDDATYTAKLLAPDTIRWSNGSAWRKTLRVPDVIDKSKDAAKAIIVASGFTVGVSDVFVDTSCNHLGVVGKQEPGGGTTALPGTAVNIHIGVAPRICP